MEPELVAYMVRLLKAVEYHRDCQAEMESLTDDIEPGVPA